MTTLSHAAPSTGHFTGLVRAEWTKFLGARSTCWTGVVLLLTAAVEVVFHTTQDLPVQELPTAQLALGARPMLLLMVWSAVLAALVVTGEYGTKAIRNTLLAVPRRGQLLAAKAILTVLVVGVVGLVTQLANYGIDLGRLHYQGDPFSGAVLLQLATGWIPVVLTGLLGLGLGVALRNSTAAVAAVLFLLVIAFMLQAFQLLRPVAEQLPGPLAVSAQTFPVAEAVGYSAAPITALLAWTVAATGAGYAALRGRDA